LGEIGHQTYFVQQSKWLLPRSLRVSQQWTRGREIDLMENSQNKADGSGVCRFQIKGYDNKAVGPARPLIADECKNLY